MYVTSAATDNVLRYDGITGAFIDAFVPPGSGGLNDPTALVFGPDGNLYVASGAHSNFYNSILRYNGTTGAFIDVFVAAGSAGLTLAPTAGVIFGPDVNADGTQDLYVSNGEVDEVLIYSGANGSFLQKLIPPKLGGLDDPKGLLFDNEGNLLVIGNSDASAGHYADVVKRFGPSSLAKLTVTLSSPSESPVTVDFNTQDGSARAAEDYVTTSSTLTFAPGETARTILIQTNDDAFAESNETFSVILSNPEGADIADGTGVATIFDDDSTKFYVVNDASLNQTYEYDSSGAPVELYSLTSGNTTPRGAASTAAGDRVWVGDMNKNVYVYDADGTLLGSWSAGSLSRNAQVQGIATDGTDVWIVDAAQDKVFRYASAASRLSGSQNAASSFSPIRTTRIPRAS
jgi:DNA-binding beta-propeller fold protein YncE